MLSLTPTLVKLALRRIVTVWEHFTCGFNSTVAYAAAAQPVSPGYVDSDSLYESALIPADLGSREGSQHPGEIHTISLAHIWLLGVNTRGPKWDIIFITW